MFHVEQFKNTPLCARLKFYVALEYTVDRVHIIYDATKLILAAYTVKNSLKNQQLFAAGF